jgi:hypothetical protein
MHNELDVKENNEEHNFDEMNENGNKYEFTDPHTIPGMTGAIEFFKTADERQDQADQEVLDLLNPTDPEPGTVVVVQKNTKTADGKVQNQNVSLKSGSEVMADLHLESTNVGHQGMIQEPLHTLLSFMEGTDNRPAHLIQDLKQKIYPTIQRFYAGVSPWKTPGKYPMSEGEACFYIDYHLYAENTVPEYLVYLYPEHETLYHRAINHHIQNPLTYYSEGSKCRSLLLKSRSPYAMQKHVLTFIKASLGRFLFIKKTPSFMASLLAKTRSPMA